MVSIGKLCDAGCEAIFKKDIVHITKNNQILLEGKRNAINGLWEVPLHPEQCNLSYMSKNVREMTRFMFAALGSPSLSTLHKAIRKGYLKSWPGLTTTNVTQHIQFNDATMKGHLDHVRKNLRSTTTTNTECKEIEAEHKTHFAFAAVKEIGKNHTDQTGAFPVLSSRGYRYIFILYHYDTNAILTEPLKTERQTKLIGHMQNWFNIYNKDGIPQQYIGWTMKHHR